MKNTNPIFSLKNFRSFGEEGADFELAPITVLTGCNSAGKSSLVKALMLLSNETFIEGSNRVIGSDYSDEDFDRHIAGADVVRNRPSRELKVSSKEFGLGRYDKVLHKNASDGTIVMSYKIWSYYLQEEVIVKRFYKAGEDILNEGVLTEYSIEKKDGTTLYKYFWDNERINFYDPEMGEVDCPRGWVEIGNINAVEEKCNSYIDFCSFINCQNNQKFYSNWYSRFGSSNNTDESMKERVEKMLSLANKRMDEIKNQRGDEIDEYRLSKDWEITYSPSEIFADTKKSERPIANILNDKGMLLFRLQNNVFHRLVNECVFPWFIKDMVYVDSSSASVKRLYSIEDENKLCVALGKLVKQGKTGNFVNKWLKKFGIADSIEVVGTDEGIGIMVYLIKGDEKCLLADEGYGITQLVSLFLQMQNTIIDNTRSWTITDPETFEDTYEYYYLHSFIAVEEPEIHLHPKYQSLLADMFVEAYQKYNIHFIIETHSEYLIRKLQVLVADKENKLTPNDVSLNYVDKDENGISTNRKIEILEDGRLSEPFGPGFFDEATGLSMHLLKMKMGSK